MIDLKKFQDLLDEVAHVDEKIADRGPILVIPRPTSEVPNHRALRARHDELFSALSVRRNYKVARGHDLNANPDLSAVGIVEEIKQITAGKDAAFPQATVLVRVHYPAGDHLWHPPEDLEPAP